MLIVCLIIASQTFLSKFLLTSFYALCLEAHIFGSCSYCNEKGVVSWCFRVMLSLTHAHTPFLLTKWGNEWNFLQHASTVLTFFFKEQFWCRIWEGEGIFCWDGAEPSALLVIIFAPFFLIVFFTFSPPPVSFLLLPSCVLLITGPKGPGTPVGLSTQSWGSQSRASSRLSGWHVNQKSHPQLASAAGICLTPTTAFWNVLKGSSGPSSKNVSGQGDFLLVFWDQAPWRSVPS